MDLQLKQGGHSVVLYGNIDHVTLISKLTLKCEIKVLLNVNLISELMWYEWTFFIFNWGSFVFYRFKYSDIKRNVWFLFAKSLRVIH